MRARWVNPRLPPSTTTRARTWSASTRTASLARSPTSAWVSAAAFTKVPMPPSQSMSAEAVKMAETSSGGVSASGGDAHGLVVVALAAPRSEGVAQPETVADADLVGQVGERCRSPVGRDDQVGVLTVGGVDIGGRLYRARDHVVGDREQPAHE